MSKIPTQNEIESQVKAHIHLAHLCHSVTTHIEAAESSKLSQKLPKANSISHYEKGSINFEIAPPLVIAQKKLQNLPNIHLCWLRQFCFS